MVDNNIMDQIKALKKFEQKILKAIAIVQKSNAVRVSFREINVSKKDFSHDFDAPGDIYKTFSKIQEAVLNEYNKDLENVREQIKRLEAEL